MIMRILFWLIFFAAYLAFAGKILAESVGYDAKIKKRISEFYSQTNEIKKKQLFNMIASGVDVTSLIQHKEPSSIKISI